jgi:hypothetical protein
VKPGEQAFARSSNAQMSLQQRQSNNTKGEKKTVIKIIPCLLIALCAVGCAGKSSAPGQARVEKDPRITAIEQSIAKTTPEGKEMIQQLKALKPEVNTRIAGKSLGEIVDEYAINKGNYNLTPLGWEASQKKNGRWKLMFHYQDYQKQIASAEWEYDPQAKKLYPFEVKNAPGFWVAESAAAQSASTKTRKSAAK